MPGLVWRWVSGPVLSDNSQNKSRPNRFWVLFSSSMSVVQELKQLFVKDTKIAPSQFFLQNNKSEGSPREILAEDEKFGEILLIP